MTASSIPNPVSWALLCILVVTAWRVILLAFNGTDLFVDEAQYWLWGQDLAFGYYSKPPLIGWVIRASTELGASDSTFWVRLPAPLFHAVTGIAMICVTARLRSALAAGLVGVAYVTLPAISFGSQFISTDTIMLPFLALALLAFVALAQICSLGWAVVLGVAIGFGLMAKYAMIYFVGCAILTAALFPAMRIGRRQAVVAALVAALIMSPNLYWNLSNELTTFQHTASNANWNGVQFKFNKFAEFLGAQFSVFGPILFGAYLWICYLTISRRTDRWSGILVAMSLPILLIVIGQSLMSHAYSNWAAATYIAAAILTVPWLLEHNRRLLKLSFGLHFVIAIMLPAASAMPNSIGHEDFRVFARVLGRADNSHKIIGIARQSGLKTIVGSNRDMIADLFYRLKNSDISVHAVPRAGRAANHYELKHPLPTEWQGKVLLVTTSSSGPACVKETEFHLLEQWTPRLGAYRRSTFYAFEVLPGCWRHGA